MEIEKLTEDIFKVTVSGSPATRHEVTVTDIVHYHLTNGRLTKEGLLDFSFEFLLDQEPNTLISSKFDITVISQYFREYGSKFLRILS